MNNAVAQINNARNLVSRITLGLQTGHYNVQVLQDGTLTIHSPSVNTPTSIGPNTANPPCGNLSDGAIAGIAVGFTIGLFLLFGCLVAACVQNIEKRKLRIENARLALQIRRLNKGKTRESDAARPEVDADRPEVVSETTASTMQIFPGVIAVGGSSRDRATTAVTPVSGTRSLASSSVTAYGNIDRPGDLSVVVSDAGGLNGKQRKI